MLEPVTALRELEDRLLSTVSSNGQLRAGFELLEKFRIDPEQITFFRVNLSIENKGFELGASFLICHKKCG